MSTITPGPWTIELSEAYADWASISRPGQPLIETTLADARAIAAVPDMIAALKRAIPWMGKLIADGTHLNSVAPNDAVGALEQLEAALAKVEAQA
jgi:hypothetical protein